MNPKRNDYPHAWWLITNRGLAKRPTFMTQVEVDRFTGILADVVETGDLEVHAYTILTNHFHILVRSPRGRLSEAMQKLEHTYVRWFNRVHRRDGPLFKGRFHGRLIEDLVHWEIVIRYIDLNPVRAGLVKVPSDHPHGSAYAYRWSDGPGWLTRSEVERTIMAHAGTDCFEPET